MKFRLIHQQTSNNAQSPVRVVEQTTGHGVSWINRYLDREYIRRLANTTLRTYAHDLLHFVRWWESAHHTGDIVEGDLTESTLLDYVRFQSSQQPRPSPFVLLDHQEPLTVRCDGVVGEGSVSSGGTGLRRLPWVCPGRMLAAS